jgi:Rhodopirellula transposase DDE domain
MAITVCHYPPGTSKWNQIEHRLFSFMSLNWKGKPLVNFETVVNLIGRTRTNRAESQSVLDINEYETGVENQTEISINFALGGTEYTRTGTTH